MITNCWNTHCAEEGVMQLLCDGLRNIILNDKREVEIVRCLCHHMHFVVPQDHQRGSDTRKRRPDLRTNQ